MMIMQCLILMAMVMTVAGKSGWKWIDNSDANVIQKDYFTSADYPHLRKGSQQKIVEDVTSSAKTQDETTPGKVIKYKKLAAKNQVCLEHTVIKSAEECKTAAKSVGLKTSDFWKDKGPFPRPKGCSWGSWYGGVLIFNKVGNTSPKASPICVDDEAVCECDFGTCDRATDDSPCKKYNNGWHCKQSTHVCPVGRTCFKYGGKTYNLQQPKAGCDDVDVDGGWGNYGPCGDCVGSCGKGKCTMKRKCDKPPRENSGADCQGSDSKEVVCDTGKLCPVNGGWGNYGPCGDCVGSCGKGKCTMKRKCDKPPPQNGGADCQGSDSKEVVCDTGKLCPVSVHPCDKGNNGGCTHKCTKKGDEADCSCNKGYLLATDLKTCNKKEYKNQVVKCLSSGKGISVTLGKGDYANFPNRKLLQVGSCKFAEDGTIEADATTCGLRKKLKDETIIYSTEITNIPGDTMITRDPLVKVEIKCTFCCTVVNKASSSNFDPSIDDITGNLAVHSPEHNYQLSLTLLKKDGSTPKDGETITIEVGETVTFKVAIKGAPADVKVRAVKCWTKPTNGVNGKDLKYNLMDKSCPVDDTFKTKAIDSDINEQLTFKSFVYVHDRASRIEVHCNLVACKKSDDCGVCVKNGSRRRRNIIDDAVIKAQVGIAEMNVVEIP